MFATASSLPSSNSMTSVSNDLSLSIKAYNIYGYFTVAASVGIIYDWALTFEQEVELFWKRRWSLVSILYLSIRYVGIVYVVLRMLSMSPHVFRVCFF
ncbi:hypothetical protein BDR07DRAFT_1402665 [Suillus spraguei]|nr:hypothetical protein BDR07DRAFT_1402665 [Suillus spraguei]